MRVTSATLADRDALLAAIRAAELLTAPQFTKAAAIAPAGSAENAASALVAAGLLTRYQADRLLAGRTEGFSLGQYLILEQLSRGPMGRVFKAKHRTMNRSVVIKVLASELTRTPQSRQMFHREVRAAGKLTHTNIATAYDANEYNDRLYLVTEFVDGASLEALVRERGPMPMAEACEAIRQIAAGLNYAHRQGMVHGNLNPGNIFLARPSLSVPFTVKIADFGIAKLAHRTPDFAAPELNHSPVDIAYRADLYSLGCVFYFLLTGRPPFAGGTAEEKVRKHMWDEPQRVEELRPELPSGVAAVVHRLLAKYPDDRFTSAAELLTHLDVACMPLTVPQEGAVNLELSPFDSDYLLGRTPQPTGTHESLGSSIPTMPALTSPWAQLTDEAIENTIPFELDDTPLATPHKPKPTGLHGEPVPIWVTVCLLAGVVVFCMIAIGVIVKLLL